MQFGLCCNSNSHHNNFSTFKQSSPELRVVTADNRSVLVVREVVSEHDGIYTCRAENVAGSVTCSATLNVVPDTEWEDVAELVSPSFVKKLASVRVMDGEEVQFTCQVSFYIYMNSILVATLISEGDVVVFVKSVT
jgi:hypothetical protein